jgi:hypothetical protein
MNEQARRPVERDPLVAALARYVKALDPPTDTQRSSTTATTRAATLASAFGGCPSRPTPSRSTRSACR